MPSMRLKSIQRNKQRDFTFSPKHSDDQLIAEFEIEIDGVYGELRFPVDEGTGHWSQTWFDAEDKAKKALHRIVIS